MIAEDEIYWRYLHRSQSGWQHGVLAKQRNAVEGMVGRHGVVREEGRQKGSRTKKESHRKGWPRGD